MREGLEEEQRRHALAGPRQPRDLFKSRPSLAAEILAEVLDVSLPPYSEKDDDDIGAVFGGLDLGQVRWCAEPIETGVPGFVLRPPVLGRAAVPVVTDPEEAARRPELGVLSAVAHGETEQGLAIASVVLPVINELDDERASFYHDLVYNSLNEAARRELENMKHEYQSDFAKRYVAQGLAEGRAESLLAVLQARGIAVPDAIRQRILTQKNAERLELWLKKAAVAASVAEVIDEPS